MYWFYLIPDSIILLTVLRFSSADQRDQEGLFASYLRNPVSSCSTTVRWGGGGGSFKHSTAGLSGPTCNHWACGCPTQCAILNYTKFTAKRLEGFGLLVTFFIRTSDVQCQHVKQGVSFEIATSVLGCKHQGQRLARNTAQYIEPWPICSRVHQMRAAALRSAVLPDCGRTLKLERGQECYWVRLWKMFLAILLYT